MITVNLKTRALLVDEMRGMIWELRSMNCRTEDLLICMNPLIEKLLFQQMIESGMYWSNMPSYFKTFEGIDIHNKWPYMEVVIYDAKNVFYHPELLRKFILK